jgi:hypothetical protein
LLASLRLYFAALAECTTARGEEVWNGRRKDGGAIALGVARKRVVGEACVRHEGQYRWAAMVVVVGSINFQYCYHCLPAISMFAIPERRREVGAEVSLGQYRARARMSSSV